MEHVTLFVYFLLLSSGFAGVTVTAILYRRIGAPLLGWFVAVISAFTVWLLLALVLYYLERIILYPLPLGEILDTATYLLAILIYALLFVCILRAWPQGGLARAILFSAPLILGYLVLAPALMVFPALRPDSPAGESLLSFLFVVAGSLYVGYGGYAFLQGAGVAVHETVAFMLRGLGRLMIVFAPVAALGSLAVMWIGSGGDPTVPLDFLLFFGWNILALAAFIRYLTMPTALLEEGRVSDGFLKEFAVSPREAEVVELISHGLSNKEIASAMNVSFATARTHVYNIFKKTGARSRVELLRIVSGYRE